MERESLRERENRFETWTYVSPRRKRASRADRGKTDNNKATTTISNGTTTCYVNNLPEDIGEKEVERMFERWGKVVDVYIAKKRNKSGRFFGFVRFVGINDEKWLEGQFKDVWFGSYKAWVNISRFARPYRSTTRKRQNMGEEKQDHSARKNVRNNKYNKNEKDTQKWKSFRQEGRTYAEATRNREESKTAATTQTNEPQQRTRTKGHVSHGDGKKGSTGLEIALSEEEMEWAKSGYVGFVKNIEKIHLIQQQLEEEGITSIRAIPMGGDRMFLKVDENEDFKLLVEESQQFFQEVFSVIREWEPKDVRGARYVWVRALGIPVHAWRRKVFSLLTISVGRLIDVDKATEDMERLDVARFLIRTPQLEFINKVVKININKESYNIRITEELCDCNFEERLVVEESPIEEEEGSIDSDDTCIAASMASLEDEETMKKIEENYEQLMMEDGNTKALNETAHETIQRRNEEYQGELENRKEETNIELINSTFKKGDKSIEGGGKEILVADNVENSHNGMRECIQGEMIRKENENREENGGPVYVPSPIQQSGQQIPQNNNMEELNGAQNAKQQIEIQQVQAQPVEVVDRAATQEKGTTSKVNKDIQAGSDNIMSEGCNKLKRKKVDQEESKEHRVMLVRTGAEEKSQDYKDRRKRRIAILKEKRKAARKGKKEASSCTCSQRIQTQSKDNGKLEFLLTENDIERNNWRLLHGDAKEVARDVWDLGKEFGLVHKGEEGEILQELTKGTKDRQQAL
ncbi:hypothetical protein P8452_48790 [Trifolium repens]|nr:hypothetical protein P8452_48790 [Trifolium repens]